MKKIDNLKLKKKNRFINLPAYFKNGDNNKRFLNIKKNKNNLRSTQPVAL